MSLLEIMNNCGISTSCGDLLICKIPGDNDVNFDSYRRPTSYYHYRVW